MNSQEDDKGQTNIPAAEKTTQRQYAENTGMPFKIIIVFDEQIDILYRVLFGIVVLTQNSWDDIRLSM